MENPVTSSHFCFNCVNSPTKVKSFYVSASRNKLKAQIKGWRKGRDKEWKEGRRKG